MSNKERCIALLNDIEDEKLASVVAVLQNRRILHKALSRLFK